MHACNQIKNWTHDIPPSRSPANSVIFQEVKFTNFTAFARSYAFFHSHFTFFTEMMHQLFVAMPQISKE